MKSLTIHQHTKIQDLAEFFNKVGDADRVRGEKLDNGLTRLYVRDRSFLTVIKEHLFEDDKLRVAKSRTLAQDAIREVLKQRDGGTMIDAAMQRIDTALIQTPTICVLWISGNRSVILILYTMRSSRFVSASRLLCTHVLIEFRKRMGLFNRLRFHLCKV